MATTVWSSFIFSNKTSRSGYGNPPYRCNPPSAYPFPDRKASPNEIPPGRLLPERIPFLSVCEYEPLWDVMYLSPWQSRNQRRNIIPLSHIKIIQPQRTEEITGRPSLRVAQFFQVLIEPAVVSAMDISLSLTTIIRLVPISPALLRPS